MIKEKYENWTKEFMESWKELDWRRTLETLSNDVKYYENPIDDPCKNFEEVTNLWNVVEENQKDINYKYEIISFDENVCIINWQMTRTMTKTNEIQEIDGIFQISLNDDNECVYFKSWEMVKE